MDGASLATARDGRRDDTQSCRASLGEHVWWCWRVKSGADGQNKLETSYGTWRRRKLMGNLSRSSVEPRLPGSCDGVFSWLAVRPKLLLCLSSKHALV